MFEKFKKEKGTKDEKQIDSRTVGMLILFVVVTMVVFAVYRFLLDFYYFEIVLIAYMVISSVLILIYIIYNRGLSGIGVTADRLPDEWSEEKKTEFVESSRRRLKRSRWLLIPIFAFLFTFAVDLIELLVVPFVSDLFFS